MQTTTVAFVGDVMLGRGVGEELPHRSPAVSWGTALPVLRGSDAVFGNLECAITESEQRWNRTRKVFHFRSGPAAVAALEAANIRCVALANNHILDFQEQGLYDTIRHLDASGIAHAGAGRNRAEAEAPAIVRLPGITVGFVSMTDNEPAFAATDTTCGTSFCDIEGEPDEELREHLAGRVAACRAAGADLSVLSLHWGPNMVAQPPPVFRRFAQEAIECGFDLIHGHSAHIFQGVAVIAGRPVLYDTGDFIDDYVVDEYLRNDRSFIFLADIAEGVIERIRMIPVRLRYARVDLATAEERDAICSRMVERCAALGTPVETGDGVLQITLPSTARASIPSSTTESGDRRFIGAK